MSNVERGIFTQLQKTYSQVSGEVRYGRQE